MTATSSAGPGAWTFLFRYRARLVTGALMLVATNAFALAIPWLLGRTVDALSGPDPGGDVLPLALAMIAMAILQAVARIGSRVALFNAARMAESDLRSLLFGHLLTLEPAFYRDHPVGDVMSRLTNDVQTVRAMWGAGHAQRGQHGVRVHRRAGADARHRPVAHAVGAPALPQHRRARQHLRPPHLPNQPRGAGGARRAVGAVQEDLAGVQVIKTYGLEDERQGHFSKRSTRLLERNMALTQVRGQLMPVLGAVASLGTVIVLFMGGRAVIARRHEPRRDGAVQRLPRASWCGRRWRSAG